MAGLVPYSSNSLSLFPQTTHVVITPGQTHGVYIAIHTGYREWLLEKIEGWFAGRDEISLLDVGTSDKLGLGYLILEWKECEIDPLFLAILRDEEIIEDYT